MSKVTARQPIYFLVTMAVIFISHSKRDEQLVRNIQTVLINVGHTPIIEEFIPEFQRNRNLQ